MHNVLFQVSLNDGSTYQEGRGILTETKGGASSWQKLHAFLEANDLTIVSLVLVTKDQRTFNLPSLGSNPNFAPFRDSEKPIEYKVFRAIAQETHKIDKGMEVKDWYTVAEAVYNDCKLQLWVNELNTRNCWGLVIKT